MAAEAVHTFTDANFEAEVLKADQPVLVDFWAEWCGPCRMLGPVIDEIATESVGKIKVGKVDVDANNAIAAKYGIQSIPTMMVFIDGEMKESIVGALSKAQILSKIEPYVSA